MTERHQSFSEEIANSITHGLFLLASVAATPYLIAKAIQTKNNLIKQDDYQFITIQNIFKKLYLRHLKDQKRV